MRRWPAGIALVLRRSGSFLRCCLLYLWGRCGRTLRLLRRRGRALRLLRLIVLLHDGVLRLVAVILGLQRLLLLRVGIPVSRILPLVNR